MNRFPLRYTAFIACCIGALLSTYCALSYPNQIHWWWLAAITSTLSFVGIADLIFSPKYAQSTSTINRCGGFGTSLAIAPLSFGQTRVQKPSQARSSTPAIFASGPVIG